MSAHPDRKWVAQQARNAAMHFAEQPQKPTILLRDNDGKFSPEFDQILEAEGMRVKKIVPVSPNLNAYAERWVQSVKQECLQHFVVFGEEHLRYLVFEYLAHYNAERPHQGKDNLPLNGIIATDSASRWPSRRLPVRSGSSGSLSTTTAPAEPDYGTPHPPLTSWLGLRDPKVA